MGKMMEVERSDGKREWVREDGITFIYDPKVCSPKHFFEETGIDPVEQKEVSNNVISVSIKNRHTIIKDIETGEQIMIYFGSSYRSITSFVKHGGEKFQLKNIWISR